MPAARGEVETDAPEENDWDGARAVPCHAAPTGLEDGLEDGLARFVAWFLDTGRGLAAELCAGAAHRSRRPATGLASRSPTFSDSHETVRDKSCQIAQFCATLPSVNGREFITRARKLARRKGIVVRFDRTRGKGSHGTLYFGDRRTVVKDRRKPLKTGTLLGMCRQLGIDPNDL